MPDLSVVMSALSYVANWQRPCVSQWTIEAELQICTSTSSIMKESDWPVGWSYSVCCNRSTFGACRHTSRMRWSTTNPGHLGYTVLQDRSGTVTRHSRRVLDLVHNQVLELVSHVTFGVRRSELAYPGRKERRWRNHIETPLAPMGLRERPPTASSLRRAQMSRVVSVVKMQPTTLKQMSVIHESGRRSKLLVTISTVSCWT